VCVCAGTHRGTFADEAMWRVTGHSAGPSIATRFPLASIKHRVTALTCRGAADNGHLKTKNYLYCIIVCFQLSYWFRFG